jgi:hypothetical protein
VGWTREQGRDCLRLSSGWNADSEKELVERLSGNLGQQAVGLETLGAALNSKDYYGRLSISDPQVSGTAL